MLKPLAMGGSVEGTKESTRMVLDLSLCRMQFGGGVQVYEGEKV